MLFEFEEVFFRLMQQMWEIGNSWRISSRTRVGEACAEGAMTHLREVNLWCSDFTWHKGTKWRTGGLVLWKLGSKDWNQNPAILIRRNRFVHFFSDLSTMVYFFREGGAIAVSVLWTCGIVMKWIVRGGLRSGTPRNGVQGFYVQNIYMNMLRNRFSFLTKM